MLRDNKSGRWLIALTLIVLLSYWKLVFTKQFSILWQWEMVSQYYSWYTFAANYIHQGIIPMWDPFRYGGNSFIGEMQTGLFYPLKLALYLAPLDQHGLLSERAFNLFYVFTHWLTAFFMFLLVRYLKLGNLAALVAGICFGLGGFVQWTAWMNILDAMPWLPLIVMLLLRAFAPDRTSSQLTYACIAGLALGMTLLAGSLHIAAMDVIVVISLAAFLWWPLRRDRSISWTVALVAAVVITSILFGAVQLLPSLEYGKFAYRWVGAESPIRPLQRTPYSAVTPLAFGPQSLFALVLSEVDAGKSDWTPYFGILPLVLAIIGIWKYWSKPIVRYLAVLAVLAYLYTWGGSSLLHGILYLVPYLDVAREPDRFIYLTQFALSILAAFGIQFLFADRKPGELLHLDALVRILKWLTLGFAVVLAAASLHLPIQITEKTYLSFFFVASAFLFLLFMQRARKTAAAQIALVFLITWDLYSLNWLIQPKSETQKVNGDSLAQIVYDGKLAGFFKAQPGMPRVHFDVPDGSPNIGDAYGVPITWAMSATMLMDYTAGIGSDRQRDLLNVQYTVRRHDPASANAAVYSPVYSDDAWDVFENPSALPRAWVAHRVEVDASADRPLKQVLDPHFDLRHTAIIDRPVDRAIQDISSQATEPVRWLKYEPNQLDVEVSAEEPGLLMLSEVFYPGWAARVDDHDARIFRADGLIRAVLIPQGTHRVSLRYEPASVRWGAILTLASFLVVCVAAFGMSTKLRYKDRTNARLSSSMSA